MDPRRKARPRAVGRVGVARPSERSGAIGSAVARTGDCGDRGRPLGRGRGAPRRRPTWRPPAGSGADRVTSWRHRPRWRATTSPRRCSSRAFIDVERRTIQSAWRRWRSWAVWSDCATSPARRAFERARDTARQHDLRLCEIRAMQELGKPSTSTRPSNAVVSRCQTGGSRCWRDLDHGGHRPPARRAVRRATGAR